MPDEAQATIQFTRALCDQVAKMESALAEAPIERRAAIARQLAENADILARVCEFIADHLGEQGLVPNADALVLH
jgi:hypothetical protein